MIVQQPVEPVEGLSSRLGLGDLLLTVFVTVIFTDSGFPERDCNLCGLFTSATASLSSSSIRPMLELIRVFLQLFELLFGEVEFAFVLTLCALSMELFLLSECLI